MAKEDDRAPDLAVAAELLVLAMRVARARKAMSTHVARAAKRGFPSSHEFIDDQVAVGTELGEAEDDLSNFIDKLCPD